MRASVLNTNLELVASLFTCPRRLPKQTLRPLAPANHSDGLGRGPAESRCRDGVSHNQIDHFSLPLGLT